MEKTIQQKLLEYYKENWGRCPKDDLRIAKQYLSDKEMNRGVCFCAYAIFNELMYLYNTKIQWIQRNIKEYDVWTIRPRDTKSIEELIQSVETRIAILEKEAALSIQENKE